MHTFWQTLTHLTSPTLVGLPLTLMVFAGGCASDTTQSSLSPSGPTGSTTRPGGGGAGGGGGGGAN
jgi:hypothetical protein